MNDPPKMVYGSTVCDAMAELHSKGVLTGDDLRNIIKSVRERYSDKTWR